MISHDELKERLHYSPEGGLFWWKPKPPTTRANRSWNTRYADKIAGSRSGEPSAPYGQVRIDGQPYYLHRLAWFYVTGEWPEEIIDHGNGRRLDNAFENLREATYQENAWNTRSKRPDQLKGVSQLKNGRWGAWIKANGASQFLGSFDTPEKAHAAYVARATEVFGEFARAA